MIADGSFCFGIIGSGKLREIDCTEVSAFEIDIISRIYFSAAVHVRVFKHYFAVICTENIAVAVPPRLFLIRRKYVDK